jgi:hypothetical protein
MARAPHLGGSREIWPPEIIRFSGFFYTMNKIKKFIPSKQDLSILMGLIMLGVGIGMLSIPVMLIVMGLILTVIGITGFVGGVE